MTNLRRSDILYPVYPDINDQPEPPTQFQGGNGADFIQRFNNLVSAIAPRLQLDFSSTETDLGITFSEYVLMMLPVPFATYLANPSTTNWEILAQESTSNFNVSQVQEPVHFAGLTQVFTVGLLAGGGYGGGSPLDDSYLEAMEIEGRASFIDLPIVYDFESGRTWNNLVGIFPLEPNLKIKLRPSSTQPTVNQLINASNFTG